MISRRLRLWLAVLVLIAAAVLIGISLLPSPRIQQVLPVPPVVLPMVHPTPSSGAVRDVPPAGEWAAADGWIGIGRAG